MKNKVLVKLVVPEIDEAYDIFIPVNIRIGLVIKLLDKLVFDVSGGLFEMGKKRCLYNEDTAEAYPINALVRETNIRSGRMVILM